MKQICSTPKEEKLELSNMMQMLLDCAKNNAGRKAQGMRYESTLKELGALIYTLAGPLLYGILSSNLPLPSVSRAQSLLLSQVPMNECVFRFKELRSFLLDGHYPLKVTVSEDGTKNAGRVQYDVKTNQLVRFVPRLNHDGVPDVFSFPATSGAEIQKHFSNGVVSNNVYVVIAQPLAPNAPSICLCLYGTDGKFSSSDVQRRWDYMLKAAKEEGIEIVSFASDGDPKLLKAMVSETFLPSSDKKWPWFSIPLRTKGPTHIQDTIHLLMKLRSKLLKVSEIIPFGKIYVASRGHLIELFNTVSKDQHELTMNAIELKDKMNFISAQKLCEKKVSDLLRQFIPGSEATATYLDMMREISAAFLDPQLTPLQRISYMWEWTFFLRMWRSWLLKQDGCTLSHNFISSNAYSCVELTAPQL